MSEVSGIAISAVTATSAPAAGIAGTDLDFLAFIGDILLQNPEEGKKEGDTPAGTEEILATEEQILPFRNPQPMPPIFIRPAVDSLAPDDPSLSDVSLMDLPEAEVEAEEKGTLSETATLPAAVVPPALVSVDASLSLADDALITDAAYAEKASAHLKDSNQAYPHPLPYPMPEAPLVVDDSGVIKKQGAVNVAAVSAEDSLAALTDAVSADISLEDLDPLAIDKKSADASVTTTVSADASSLPAQPVKPALPHALTSAATDDAVQAVGEEKLSTKPEKTETAASSPQAAEAKDSARAARAEKTDATAALAANTDSAQPMPSKPQTISARVGGIAVHHDMVSALAHADESLDMGLGADAKGYLQDMTGIAAALKPETVDTAQKAHFTNYLSAARGAPATLTQMVSLQLQRNMSAQIDTMTLQLTPADLGKLDIKMKFDKDGGVKAHLTVEKAETLALLQKDAHHLEKVLSRSGLDVDKNAITFDLRHQQDMQHGLKDFDGWKNNNGRGAVEADMAVQAKMAVETSGYYITSSGVNIMV